MPLDMSHRTNTDYERVEKAIRYLETHFRSQPSLAELAASAGLSEFHFQRLFQRWAGLSPKRFLQVLTAGYAEQLLRESRSLLDVTLEAGLSSPSRLHGLFVSLHAMSPAEWRDNGRGLVIRYGLHPSPFGDCLLATTDRGICALRFADQDGGDDLVRELRAEWPAAKLEEDRSQAKSHVQRIFDLSRNEAPLPVLVRGTNFQVKVWEALLRIPPGHAASYGDIAAALQMPRASRAVGTAIAGNPVAFLIPCHRVIRQSGVIGEYRWGAVRKKAMLAWESAYSRVNEERFAASWGLS
jgi:AraC family transcriptional regulator, regulatory protein of adaptative response / methylated-DNA-[protein]-cysteine methyltransferase